MVEVSESTKAMTEFCTHLAAELGSRVQGLGFRV